MTSQNPQRHPEERPRWEAPGSSRSTALEAEIAEIDENLIRKDLDAWRFVKTLKRREELYLLKFPKTGNGRASPVSRRAEEGSDYPNLPQPSFAADAAAKTGLSQNYIRDNIKLAEDLGDETLDRIADKGFLRADLERLRQLEPDVREEVLKQVEPDACSSTRQAQGTSPPTLSPRQ